MKPLKKKSSPKKTEGFLGKSPIALIVYGVPGVGKTEFAAHFPNCGFLVDPQEDGITDLVEFNRCPKPEFTTQVDSWKGLLTQLENVAAKQTCETLILDSLTGFEKLCFQHHCKEYFDNDWSSKGFYAFQQGPKNAAKTDWPVLLDHLETVRQSGINIILIGHATVKPFNNPEGADYDRYIPYVDKETWQQSHRWAKAVFFYNYYVELEKKGTKNKAKQSSQSRYLYTEWSAAFDAKNRYGLEPLIDGGSSGKEAYDNFVAAFKKAAGE